MRMLIRAALACLLALVASPGFAQGTMAFGVQGGVNFANLSVDPDDACCDTKTGFAAGGSAEIDFGGIFSFQPEVLYTQKGAEDSEGGTTVRINLDFVAIPLLAKVKFRAGRAAPYVVVGPSVAFTINAKLTAEGEDDVDLGDDVEGTDFGLIVGGGVPIGPVVIEARYDLGFRDLDPDEDFDVKTRTFSILVAYRFAK